MITIKELRGIQERVSGRDTVWGTIGGASHTEKGIQRCRCEVQERCLKQTCRHQLNHPR